jgi:hypothetical protein
VDEDFRARVQIVLEQTSSRYSYLHYDDRHYIVCRFTADDNVMVIETLLEAMRDNQALLAMTERDYRWEGGSMISFATKDNAALFYLCCLH